jgi:hypothetical protein
MVLADNAPGCGEISADGQDISNISLYGCRVIPTQLVGRLINHNLDVIKG